MISHGQCHGLFIVTIARIDVQHRNTPRIFLSWIQLHEIVRPRQALTLRFDGEVVRYVLLDPLAPFIAELWQQKGMTIHFLAAISIEAITAHEIRVAMILVASIHIFWNQETAGAPDRLPFRRA